MAYGKMSDHINVAQRAIRKFAGDRSGATAMIFALGLPVVVGFAGIAVDTTRYMRAKTIVANAADHAALAAASAEEKDRVAVATKFFEAQVPPGWADAVKVKKVTARSAPSNGGPVKVDVQIEAEVKTILGQVVGFNKFDLVHMATAVRIVNNLEVAMGLPSGGTMCAFKERTPDTNNKVDGDVLVKLKPDPSCKHFNDMKKGVEAFVKTMEENGSTNFKIGLIPYNVKVLFPNTNQIPPQIASSEPDRDFYRSMGDAEPLSAMTPITSNMATLRSKLAAMTQTPEGMAWSRTDLPTLAGGMMLDPAMKTYFGGDAIRPFNDKDVRKVIILMTDGANIGCCFTNWKPGNYGHQYVYQYKPYNDDQVKFCKLLKEQKDVTIFTILFDVQEGDTGGAAINNIFARCASGVYSEPGVNEDNPSATLRCKHKQNCYNVANGEQLIAAYRDIAQNFYAPRLTK